VPLRVGAPSSRFAHTWTIARWVQGTPADHTPITRSDAAEVLAEFLRALHDHAPDNAPTISVAARRPASGERRRPGRDAGRSDRLR
jgi:hypothetical protein